MFKRLRERIAEEATKFPVGQLNTNTGKQSDAENKTAGGNSTEDLITLSDSSSVVVPQTSSQQFSIGEDEDGSVSEQSTPQKRNDSANGATNEHSVYSSGSRDHPAGTGSDLGFGQEYRPTKSNYIPQSDIESEREDPPTLNLEGISKDQLLSIIELLKARAYKYKNKYVEVVKNYKELREEKLKIENTLIEQQDKALRRMAELREQCQLEQKAKAHLEANLRLMLEEKDSRITVLETQINLLKESAKSTIMEVSEKQNSDSSGTLIDISAASVPDDSSLKEKLERFEHQLNQANKTITAQTDQISLLRKQNESLSQELEEKVKTLNEMEDEQGQLKSKHEFILQGLQDRLKELENQQEESVMAMAETKKNMHEELEFKEKQLIKAEEEAKQFQAAYETEKLKVVELQKQQEEKVNSLQRQLESTERMLEEEKQNLMQELARGKSAAITLVQQECAKKVAAVEEEWKIRLQDVQKEKKETSGKKLSVIEEELKQKKQHVVELNSIIELLEKENSALKNSLEKLQSDVDTTSTNFDKLQADYLDLKESSDKKLVQMKEQLNQELNDKLQVYQKAEADLRSTCDSLRDQLSEKQNLLNDLVNDKSSLCHQIELLEKREKELLNESESLKNEVKELQAKCQNLASELKSFCEHDSEKILELQKCLALTELNHQDAVKELTEYKAEILELGSENKALIDKVGFLNANSDEMKNKLLVAEEKIVYLNNVLDESSREFGLLKTAIDEKLNLFHNRIEDFNYIESSLSSLEKENQCLKSEISQHETICNELIQKVTKLSKLIKLSSRHKQNADRKKNIDSELLNENSFTRRKENLISDRNIKESELSEIHRNDDILASLEGYDLTNCDNQELQKIVKKLIEENQKLKGELEVLNIEFAKNITQLHESLSELQEERNNLSLVLQSIETQSQEMSPSPERSMKAVENDNKEVCNLINQNKENNKFDIMELNNKVKSEIAALSAQTEMINRELCSLHEQFNFAKLTYSEKVLQLNSKLMRRTEQLLFVKEELDASFQNCEDLKNLLESVKEQLTEKEELLRTSEKSKEDLENKYKSAKDKYIKKELSLKQTHNAQLSDLKDQTKATIEKLNEQIQSLNAQLTERETDHQHKLSNVTEEYKQELNKLVADNQMLLQWRNVLNEIFAVNETFEAKLAGDLNKLDIFNSKIDKLSSNLRCIQTKLKEKEITVFLSQINDLECQVQSLSKDNNDLNDMKNKMNELSELYEVTVNELEKEKGQREASEKAVLSLKEKHESTLKELENKYNCSLSENENLKSLLQKSENEMKTLKEKYNEMNCSLDKVLNELNDSKRQISLLEELRVKYDSLESEKEQQYLLLQKSENELKSLRHKYTEVNCSLDKVTSELHDSKSQVSSLEELKIKYDSMQLENKQIKHSLQESENEVKSLREKYAEMNCSLDKVTSELHNSKNQVSSLKELQIKYDSMQLENKQLKHSLQESEKDMEALQNELLEVKTSLDKVTNDLKNSEDRVSLLGELQFKYDFLQSENEKLKSSSLESENDLKILKEKYAKVNSSVNKITKELNDSKNQISFLEELHIKYDSLAKDYEGVCQHLEKEKNSASEALRTASEWKSLYDSVLCNLNDFSSKSFENMKAITIGLNQNEMKLQSFEQQFLKVTTLCKAQKSQICILKEEIVNLKEVNKNLCEKIPNENHLLDMESKVNILDQKIKKVIEEKENLKSELESELESTKLNLKTVLSELESNKTNFNTTQTKLVNTLSKLEDTEKRLNEESKKVLASKNVIAEWKKKYDTTVQELKVASDSLRNAEENLKSYLKQIEEKNANISVMISKEKFESYKQNYSNKFEEMKSEIKELQAEINILSTNIKDKELEIQQIQSEKESLTTQNDENLKCLQEKLENAEKNYITQIDELKSQILQLEEEKCVLKTEKSELLKSQEKLQNEESAIKSELKLKEDELLKIQQKYETTNKEQVAKLHNFQETMKDKENMILKLKANIEAVKKENLEKTDELKRKITKLEEEREQLMIQAQERVSITEAKCREDIKALQEKNNQLLLENSEIEKLNKKISQIDKELSECNRLAEVKEITARKEISLLKDQLAKAEERLSESEKKKKEIEAELSGKIRKLEEENSSLLGKTNHFESLKAEKEELNEKLKQAEQQVTSIKMLENEKDALKNENTAILKELELLKSSESDVELKQKVESLEESEKSLLSELEELKRNKEAVENELTELKTSFEKERENLKSQNEKLQKQITLLEKMSSDPQSTASKDYIAVIRGECETAIKAKEEEMETKLKHLVRDFCIQMDVKDKDCDKMVSDLLEKNHDLEERLVREHRKEVSELRQNLFERECALDEMRDNYEEQLQEKEKKLKELQSTIKRLSENSHLISNDVAPISVEGSDWDDTWAVPEESVENSSPVPCNECKEHLQQIETLQNEVTKCNSEIKELKVLLRLSPPVSMANNSRKDPSQAIPEPTEFEYLKNIIYEYMMGKEPVTLAKVIAAVLRFSDKQTQQVIRREEARHPAMTHWLSSK
ncbi:golgin subfamily A member 4-like [Argiope bruennichi]|uniref:golgin subfamily A member 4-like n=1 Tax=Argiope bruennichi TaxID=94029 RepID=UPI0024952797|nr:golgin subfamily A member 4-like [Argiope bruennichi]